MVDILHTSNMRCIYVLLSLQDNKQALGAYFYGSIHSNGVSVCE